MLTVKGVDLSTGTAGQIDLYSQNDGSASTGAALLGGRERLDCTCW